METTGPHISVSHNEYNQDYPSPYFTQLNTENSRKSENRQTIDSTTFPNNRNSSNNDGKDNLPLNISEIANNDDDKLLRSFRETFQTPNEKVCHRIAFTEIDTNANVIDHKDEEDIQEVSLEQVDSAIPEFRSMPMNKNDNVFEINLEKIIAMKENIPYSLTVRPGFHYRGTLRHNKTLVFCIHHQRMLREFRYNGDVTVDAEQCNNNSNSKPKQEVYSSIKSKKDNQEKNKGRNQYRSNTSLNNTKVAETQHYYSKRTIDSDSSDEEAIHTGDDSDLDTQRNQARNPSCFVCYDRKNTIYFWDASKSPVPKPSTFSIRERLVEFCYISKYCVYAGCAADEMILFYNRRFVLLNSVYSTKAVVMIQYSRATNCLLTGGSHHVTVWDLEIPDERVNIKIKAVVRYQIETGLTKDDWIKSIYVNDAINSIYLILRSRLLMYNLENGSELEKLEHLSNRQITSVVFDENFNYTMTGFSDGTIKIWSMNSTFIHEFCGHYKAVIGMSIYGKGSCLISGSLDRTVRLWSLKTFREAYRINLKEPPVQVQVMDNRHLFVQLRKDVVVWFMEEIGKLYAATNSAAFHLMSIVSPQMSYRVLCLTEDGILRLFASNSRRIITTSIPFIDTEEVKNITYSALTNRVYLMLKSGEIWVLGTHLNPCVLMDIWKLSDAYKEDCNCILALDGKLSNRDGNEEINEPYTLILGGSTNGQILVYGTNGIVQARYPIHSGPISALATNYDASIIVSCGGDNAIRICTVHPRDDEIIKAQIAINNNLIPCQLVVMDSQICCSFEDGSINMYNFTLQQRAGGAMMRHSRDEDHTDSVTVLTFVSTLKIFITASLDGSVKVWDMCNALIREIQFDEPITCLCPCNEQGDLLVGLQNRVDIIKYYNYLPPSYAHMAHSISKEAADDPSIPFNIFRDMWSHVKKVHLRHRAAFIHGTATSTFQCINHNTEIESDLNLIEKEGSGTLTTAPEIEPVDARLYKMIHKRTQMVENMKSYFEKRKGLGDSDFCLTKEFDRFIKFKAIDEKYKQKVNVKPFADSEASLESIYNLPMLHDSKSLLSLRTLSKMNDIFDPFRNQKNEKEKEALEEMYRSIMDLSGNTTVNHEVLHGRLQDYIREKITVAPDGILPNSSVIHRITSWLERHHFNLDQLVVDLQGKNKKKSEVLLEDEERKKRSEEYRAKLHAMLNTMKEQIKKPEDIIEPEEVLEESLPMEMRRYTLKAPPSRNKPSMHEEGDMLPIHIVKAMEKPWFHRIENKVLKTVAKETADGQLNLIETKQLSIPATSDALMPFLLECFFDGNDTEKIEVFEYMKWLNDQMPIKNREAFYLPINEFLLKDVETMEQLEQKLKIDIINGIIESFGSDNEDFLLTLLQYLTFDKIDLQSIAIFGLQEMGFRLASSKIFTVKLQEINNQLIAHFKGNRLDKEDKEQELGKQRRVTSPKRKTKKTPYREADQDANEDSELFHFTSSEISSPFPPFKSTIKRWLRILLRKQLLKTSIRSNDACNKLKQYDIYGNLKGGNMKTSTAQPNLLDNKKTESTIMEGGKSELMTKPRKASQESVIKEQEVEEIVTTDLNKSIRPTTANISEMLSKELFSQCLSTLKNPKMIDFIHALNWYTRQLEIKFEKEEATQRAIIKREELKQQRLQEAQERAVIEEEFRRKRKEIREQRTNKIRQMMLEDEKKRQEKIQIQKIPPLEKRYKGRIRRAKCHESRETIDFCFQLPPLASQYRFNTIAAHIAQFNKSLPMEHVQPLPFGRPRTSLQERVQFTPSGDKSFSKLETNTPLIPPSEKFTDEWVKQYDRPISVETYVTKRKYFLPDRLNEDTPKN